MSKSIKSVAVASVQPNPNVDNNDKLLSVLYTDGTVFNKTYAQLIRIIQSKNTNISQLQTEVTDCMAEKVAIEAAGLGIIPVTI